MIYITYKERGHTHTEKTDDFRTALNMLIGILNDPAEEAFAYNWMSHASLGDELVRDRYKINITNVWPIPKPLKSDLTNPLIAALKQAEKSKVEWHGTAYSKGAWRIDLERHPYGQIRIWIIREDKLGNYQCDLCTIYRSEGGIRYCCEIPLTKEVYRQLIKIFELLERNGFTN